MPRYKCCGRYVQGSVSGSPQPGQEVRQKAERERNWGRVPADSDTGTSVPNQRSGPLSMENDKT